MEGNSKKLYVGGIPYTTTDTELAEEFGKAGTVESATVISDRMTGRSKGFGFVEMATPEEAQAAIEMWNGKEMGGRTILVDVARPMKERAPRSDY
jgi:RNA recognition motif-containing protein